MRAGSGGSPAGGKVGASLLLVTVHTRYWFAQANQRSSRRLRFGIVVLATGSERRDDIRADSCRGRRLVVPTSRRVALLLDNMSWRAKLNRYVRDGVAHPPGLGLIARMLSHFSAFFRSAIALVGMHSFFL